MMDTEVSSLIEAIIDDFERGVVGKRRRKKKASSPDDSCEPLPLPDSTTNTIDKEIEQSFQCGDDVLVPNKDGRYYLGTVVELSISEDSEARCLIKFGDGTHSWSAVSSLKSLGGEDGKVMCVVCKEQEPPGILNTCDMCGRGYHVHCHSPAPISRLPSSSWKCRRCVAIEEKNSRKRNGTRKQTTYPNFNTASPTSSTTSDAIQPSESHCYCGKKSDWLIQMLMCCRCSRWFHQRCITSLKYPLYAGDKLYIFACAVCNAGTEYLRRLEVRWLDVVHLALYSLTAYNAKMFFDLDTVIMPYLMDNWHALQLPEKMSTFSPAERRERVLEALSSCRARFRSGRESKKRVNLWALRHRRPPPTHPKLASIAQSEEIITDDVVKRLEPKLRFLPRIGNEQNGKRMIVQADSNWLHLMTGKRFGLIPPTSDRESNPSPPKEVNKNLAMINFDVNYARNKQEIEPVRKKAQQITKLFAMDYQNGRFVKESIPFEDLTAKSDTRSCSSSPDPEIIIRDSSIDRLNSADKPLHEKNNKIATMNLEVSKISTTNIIEHSKIMSLKHMNGFHEVESSSDETSSKGTLDAIIPPLKDFQGKNNPFLMQNNKRNRLSLPAVPVSKPLKRQLSEKDIIVGPNGEVKRKRFRRSGKALRERASLPLPGQNVRCLRQRPEKPPEPTNRRNTVSAVETLKLSPRKNESIPEPLAELKSSVRCYFGAANRARAGEKFHLIARRTLQDGKKQYLVVWDDN